jgi:uncharacterized protein YcnI
MRRELLGALVVAGGLALPSTALAHISLHPNTLPAGSSPTIDIRVPNEESKANTTKLAVKFPPGFLDVSTGYLPGWKIQVVKHKLAKPVKTEEGTVTEEISEVTWSGGRIPPGAFLDFPISAAIPDRAAGRTLTFKAVQSYDDGTIARWIGPPSADEPAPTVNVTPKGGVVEDVAGTEAGPGSPAAGGAAAPKAGSTNAASKGLGISALVVAIVALLAGLAAMVVTWRQRGRPTRP